MSFEPSQDWDTGIYTALLPILERASSSWSREEALLAFSSVDKDLLVQHPDLLYQDLLSEIHKQFATRLGVQSDPDEDKRFGASIALWPVFPDTVAALASLKKYFKLVVLSNVDNYSFHTYTRKVLEPNPDDPIFDLVITAQDVKAYKPDLAMFKYALSAIQKEFGLESDKVLVTAQSLYHDHTPANALGLCSAWIAREGACTGTDVDANYQFKFATLGEMAEAREKEVN